MKYLNFFLLFTMNFFNPVTHSKQKSTPASLAVGNFFDRLGSLLETDVASKINLFMASSAFL